MAPWALVKLLHPFTPDDLLLSQRIKSTLNLPPSTSQFVLALSIPRSPDKVVYVLSVEKLSERSIDDVHRLVAAVKPSSVVAFVDAQYLTEVVEEGKLLESPKGLDVPASYVDLIRNSFVQKIKAGAYETRARLKVLVNIFGTTFYGNVFAAIQAAEDAQAAFAYFQIPSTVASSFVNEDEDEDEDEEEVEGGDFEGKAGSNQVSFADRFRRGFSALLGDNTGGGEYLTGAAAPDNNGGGEYLTGAAAPQRPGRTLRSEDLASLSLSVTSSPLGKAGVIAESPARSSQLRSAADGALSEVSEDGWSSFGAPFYPLFLDLHQLFTETPGVNEALKFVRKVFDSVEGGHGVDHEDLSRARLFRVAVESVRVSWNSFVGQERGAALRPAEFAQLPYEEKCQALLAHALQHRAQNFGTVVAVVDASNVVGIRRHWNTPVPSEVAAYAEYCFVALDSQEIGKGGGVTSNLLENSETKAVVVVGVGAGAVAVTRLASLPHWASVSTLLNVFALKVPTVLKLAWVQMKHQAAVASSNAVMPALKAAAKLVPSSGAKASLMKSATGASSGAKAMVMKSAASAENTRVLLQHSVVATAEKATLQAIKTAFYSLMRNRQANKVGPRPWLALGGSLAAAAGFWMHGDEVEHAIGILPSAPGVVRLGRGLQELEQASGVVDDYEGSSWWNRVYETLYRNSRR